MTEPAEGFLHLLKALDRLEIQYAVAGSVASSTHGIWRSTGDVDVVARIRPGDVDRLVEELHLDFYIDAAQIRDALARKRSFNVIHLNSSYKFDIFPLTSDPYQQAQFGRRRFVNVSVFGTGPIEFAVVSPEDVILSKLGWYRQGGKASEQQWNDVLGVIAVQRDRLDYDYLCQWAAQLRIADLLEEALAERHEPLPD